MVASAPESHERIEDIDVSTEMQDSFLEYAYSVIYSRALPDARDGLKPVQRRILFMMNEMGLRPDKGHVKSARVVGEVMGKLHPHGDASIYDALVRLSQDFSLRMPLIDGHGNFGSLDDGPAAARYTEARLAASALAMNADIDEDVVDFVPNYDNQFQQPDVLPAAFPNLLVNGASGIAVGMATNMAPHNLTEVIEAAILLLEKPDATLDEIMALVPGPDLPTGGVILGKEGIREAYETGRGSFKIRATSTIGSVSARKMGITVTELPYLVGPEKIIDKIKDGVNGKKLSGISNVTDLTDRHHGLKLVIEIKTGFEPEAVLEQLYRFTPLEDSFSINNVALVNGGPQTLGLRQMLQVYVDHRKLVVNRRSQFRLNKRKERLHLVEGLLIAIADIDEVIQLIRQSDDTDQARARLMEVFELSTEQADYILELRLRRLTKFSRVELESEAATLRAEISALEEVLGSDSKLVELVIAELREVSHKLGTPRRTRLSDIAPSLATTASKNAPATSLQIEDNPCAVVLSATGKIARIDFSADQDVLTQPASRSAHDGIISLIHTSRRSELGAVTSQGRLIRFTPVSLPSVISTQINLSTSAVNASEYVELEPQEKIIGLISLTVDETIALATAQGIVKRITSESLPTKSGNILIGLKDGDEVIGASLASEDMALVFITSDAQLLQFPAAAVRPQGSSAGGMAGIRLSDGARVIYFTATTPEAVVVTISHNSSTLLGTDAGRAKLSALSEFPAKGRGTGGVRAQSLLKGEDGLALAWAGTTTPRASSLDGKPRELPQDLSKRDASGTQLEGDISFIGGSIS